MTRPFIDKTELWFPEIDELIDLANKKRKEKYVPSFIAFSALTEVHLNSNIEKANVPIIAMTANVMKEEVERCYAIGMDDFIGKPFDTEELVFKMFH